MKESREEKRALRSTQKLCCCRISASAESVRSAAALAQLGAVRVATRSPKERRQRWGQTEKVLLLLFEGESPHWSQPAWQRRNRPTTTAAAYGSRRRGKSGRGRPAAGGEEAKQGTEHAGGRETRGGEEIEEKKKIRRGRKADRVTHLGWRLRFISVNLGFRARQLCDDPPTEPPSRRLAFGSPAGSRRQNCAKTLKVRHDFAAVL